MSAKKKGPGRVTPKGTRPPTSSNARNHDSGDADTGVERAGAAHIPSSRAKAVSPPSVNARAGRRGNR